MPRLVDELWPVLLSFAQRGLGHRQDAEDVAQEVFLRICSRISEFDPTRDGVSWAFGIAAFEVMTQRRRLQRRRECTDGSELPERVDPAPSAEDDVIQRELCAVLTDALGQLAAYDVAQLGLGEPAPVGAATPVMRKRRQRALDRLRIVWRRLYGEP